MNMTVNLNPDPAANLAPGANNPAPFFKIEVGPRNAWTNPESGLRYYRWPWPTGPVDYPSVTSIRRAAGLPHGLHQWSINKVVDHAIGRAESIALRLAEGNHAEGITRALRHELREAATAERDAAANLGTAVHDAAASGKRVEDVEARLRPRLAHFQDWLDVSGAEVLGAEFQIWNPTVGYAGTGDLLVRLRNGRVIMVDLKTGKGVWVEHVLQVSAYRRGEFVGNDGVVDRVLTNALAETSGVAVLHLTDAGWEFILFRNADEAKAWRAFRGLLLFATFLQEHSTLDSIVEVRRSGASARFCRHRVDTETSDCPRCGAEARAAIQEAAARADDALAAVGS